MIDRIEPKALARHRAPLLAAALLLLVIAAPADARRKQGQGGPVSLDAPAALSPPAIWLEVKNPGKVRDALGKNAWLQEALKKPLGKGLFGSWSAFLGTRGEDLSASFKGAIADAALRTLFDQPFRVAWYTAAGAFSPVLIVPAPRDPLKLAYAAIDQVARKGAVAARCPGEAEPGLLIGRWALAEHILFVAQREDRLLFARHPAAVVQAFCGSLSPVEEGAGDLSLSLSPERLSRGAQVGASTAGLGQSVKLQLEVDGDRLVAKGLSSPLVGAGRLTKGALSPELLQLLPASAPVLLTAQLGLPEVLDVASLRAFWQGAQPARTLSRTATVLWWPRGGRERVPELAVVWSRLQDDAALGAIFSGPNALSFATLCNHVVLASAPEVVERLRRACEGKEPSVKDLGERVVRGLKAQSSLLLSVQLGRVLSQLTADGYWSEQGGAAGGALPKELEEAMRELSQLPFLGFAGTVEGAELKAWGFGS